MRIAMMLGAAALLTAGGAGAQAPGASYPVPGARVLPPPPPPHPPIVSAQLPPPPVAPMGGGRWWGGNNAPGGWAGYRAPYRGYRLPRYWVAPRFYVNDWSRYGFRAPGQGHYWTRYYDDAVLIDGRGEVQDMVSGIDWDGRGRHDGPMMGDYPPPPPSIMDRGPCGSTWVSPDGATTVTTTTGGGYGYPASAYGYGYGGSVTTVTVQSAPVVTTTTTVVEEQAVYRRAAVRKVYRKRIWHPRPRRRPACVCGS